MMEFHKSNMIRDCHIHDTVTIVGWCNLYEKNAQADYWFSQLNTDIQEQVRKLEAAHL